MRALNSAGATIHFREDGPTDAPALVFINSLGTDARIWDGVLARLPAGLRAVSYDKRGHGLSDCPSGDWGLDEHVADLEALLDRLEIAKAGLVGLSIGGVIAQSFAARRPERLSALTLMCTAARIGTVETWSERMAAIATEGLESVAEGVLERWLPPAYRAQASEFALYRNMLLRTPLHGYLRSCAALRDADLTAQAARLNAPCLVIAGEHDGATPPDLVKGTADLIAGARFQLIDGAGHLPCIDHPDKTAAAITMFLNEIGFMEGANV